jgi:hypothetical protein
MTTCHTQSTLLQKLKLQQFIGSSSKQNSALKKKEIIAVLAKKAYKRAGSINPHFKGVD